MTQLSLIVKGDKFTAAKAASERSIPFAFVREVRQNGTCETVGLTGVEQRDKVVQWFGDGAETAPFPAGTLLLYSEIS